jgi:hypothetical protein
MGKGDEGKGKAASEAAPESPANTKTTATAIPVGEIKAEPSGGDVKLTKTGKVRKPRAPKLDANRGILRQRAADAIRILRKDYGCKPYDTGLTRCGVRFGDLELAAGAQPDFANAVYQLAALISAGVVEPILEGEFKDLAGFAIIE